jgi:Fic family protein
MAWDLKWLEESLLIGSTLVEGSTLSEDEARAVLAGRTVVGHPIGELRELLNYRSAVERLMTSLTASPYVSIDLILEFHRRLFSGLAAGGGRWKSHQNYTYRSDGTRHDYLHPSAVAAEMQAWVEQLNRLPVRDPAADAALLYYRFQEIHPFDDGNGRIGRILIAYWLHWRARHSWSFHLADKLAHLEALERANRGDLGLLTAFFRDRLRGES